MILNGCSTLARMLALPVRCALAAVQSAYPARPCACPDAWRFPIEALTPLVLLPLLSALVAGIPNAKQFFSMQQGMGLGDIADVG